MNIRPNNWFEQHPGATVDLRAELHSSLRGRICLVGLGNPSHGDDGLGVRLAESLIHLLQKSELHVQGVNISKAVSPRADDPAAPNTVEVLVAGTTPERWLETVGQGEYDQVVFLDAVAFGGTPGSAVFLTSREIKNRFPQISTHRLSLGTLAQVLESGRRTQVWLLGVEPESLRPSAELTPVVQATCEALRDLLSEINLWAPAQY